MLLSVAYTMPFQSRAFCDLQYAISRMPVMFINLKKKWGKIETLL